MTEKNGWEFNIMTKPSNYIKDTSKEYSLYVAQNRAIPKVTDGLKDGQRKFLWLMRNKTDKIKTVSLAGLCISENLFLHGDSSASETISMLAAPFCNNVTLLDGVGNFGTRVGTNEWSQPRYTYVKRNNSLQELILSDLDIVPLKENYDGSNMEPVTFLPLVPMVLVNGISGIAVGWSTSILPRNLGDVIDATIKVLEGKTPKTIKPSYDYLNCDVEHIIDSSWMFSGKVEKVNSTTVVVSELPPEVSLESYKEKLNKMIDDGVIVDYDDNSAEFINIEIKFNRKSLENKTEKDLLSLLKLTQKKSERIVVLDFNNKSIKQYDNDIDLIKDFVKWRFSWYSKRYQNLKDKAEYELSYWDALKECYDKKLPSKISKMKNKKEMESEISKIISGKITLDDSQLDKISSLPSYRWAIDYYQNILDKISEINSNISYYDELLSDESKLKQVYMDELKRLKTIKFR